MSQLTVVASGWTKPHEKLDGISPIDHLFNRLDGMYPNIFKANFKSVDAINNWKNAWAEALYEDGIEGIEVKEGLKNSRRMYEFPPSLPQFLKACRHVDYEGLFIEAVKGHMSRRANSKKEVFGWSNPIAFWAGAEFGVHDLLNSQYDKVKARWQSCVEKAQREGFKPIPDVMLQLPPSKVEANPEVAKKAMGAMKSVLGNVNGRQYWADLINSEGFEKLPLITKQMAADGLRNLGVTVPEHAVKYLKKDAS